MKKGRLHAKSRAFSAVIPKGGFAPLRYVSAGTVATPFLEAFAAWPALCCAKMHGFAAASFFPDFSFTSLLFSTVWRPARHWARRALQLVEKAALLRQATYEQGLRPRSPRTAAFGGRFALHASALALRGVAGLP